MFAAPENHTSSSPFPTWLYMAALVLCLAVPRALSFLPACAALGGILIFSAQGRKPVLPCKDLLIWLACLLGVMLLSASWSFDPGESAVRAGKNAALLLGGIVALSFAGTCTARDIHRLLFPVMLGLSGIAAGLMALEYGFGFPISRFLFGLEHSPLPDNMLKGYMLNRNAVALVLIWGVCAAGTYLGAAPFKTKMAALAIGALGLCAMLVTTQSQTAQLAALTFGVFMAVPMNRVPFRYGLYALICGAIAFTPAIAGLLSQSPLGDVGDTTGWAWRASIPHRLEVWNFIAGNIANRPWLGHGIDATPFLRSAEIMPLMNTDRVLHPHNAVLQIWLEFGALGAALAIALILVLARHIENQTGFARRFFLALLITVLCVLSIGYGLWQAWQLGMITAIAAFAMMAVKQSALASD